MEPRPRVRRNPGFWRLAGVPRLETGAELSDGNMVAPEHMGRLGTSTVANLDAATVRAARVVLDGRRRGWRAILPFLGPAFIASIAYVDPGNFATNIESGAQFGYMLLWVVVASNLTAMLIQALSAKLGIATGMNLAEVCRQELPRPAIYALWAVSELAAMATDVAEVLGAAIGFHLL